MCVVSFPFIQASVFSEIHVNPTFKFNIEVEIFVY